MASAFSHAACVRANDPPTSSMASMSAPSSSKTKRREVQPLLMTFRSPETTTLLVAFLAAISCIRCDTSVFDRACDTRCKILSTSRVHYIEQVDQFRLSTDYGGLQCCPPISVLDVAVGPVVKELSGNFQMACVGGGMQCCEAIMI